VKYVVTEKKKEKGKRKKEKGKIELKKYINEKEIYHQLYNKAINVQK
tara:strand:- start:1156 stop:1296 length:141 start_codon:yes stop_codon:yes gene_type:complete